MNFNIETLEDRLEMEVLPLATVPGGVEATAEDRTTCHCTCFTW